MAEPLNEEEVRVVEEGPSGDEYDDDDGVSMLDSPPPRDRPPRSPQLAAPPREEAADPPPVCHVHISIHSCLCSSDFFIAPPKQEEAKEEEAKKESRTGCGWTANCPQAGSFRNNKITTRTATEM